MKSLSGIKLSGGRRFFGVQSYEDLHLENCIFESASIGVNSRLSKGRMDRATRVTIEKCKILRCHVGAAEISFSEFIDISCADLLICWGAVFNEVKIRGKFGGLMIHGIPCGIPTAAQVKEHQEFRKKFYADVKWALDIRDALFSDMSIRTGGVPLSLLKIDRNSQCIVKIDESALEGLALSKYCRATIDMAIADNVSEVLLVAPKLSKSLHDSTLKDMEILSREGLLDERNS